eukprot:scaffold125753_cov53-Phaeocystis_antarctica.AAC.3
MVRCGCPVAPTVSSPPHAHVALIARDHSPAGCLHTPMTCRPFIWAYHCNQSHLLADVPPRLVRRSFNPPCRTRPTTS